MRIGERDQNTTPAERDDPLTEIYGGPRPADDRFARVRGILARPGVAGLPIKDVDRYIEDIRGR